MDTGISPITVTPLSDACGASITGVDLRQPLDAATVAAIRAAWLEHVVVVFPGQKLTEDDQERFGRYLGELQDVRTATAQDDKRRSMMLITNVRDTGMPTVLEDGDMQYHYDQCYYEYPSDATILYAVEVTKEGGHTLFVNCSTAFETLPEEIKQRIDGKKALNVYDYAGDPTHRAASINWDAPHWVHPVVRTHPETRRKALYVNRLMTCRIEDMGADESDALLDTIFEHMEDSRFVYEHVWTEGDLLMWDNRCSVHARTWFDPSDRRMMRRVTVKGTGEVV